jgi:hypothetical protein
MPTSPSHTFSPSTKAKSSEVNQNFTDSFEEHSKARYSFPGLVNGKIVTSVDTGTLTVAIKDRGGSDPSASSPVYVNINGTLRTISSALSLSLDTGTNWFAAGTTVSTSNSGVNDFEIDYFVFVIWNTTDSAVNLGVSRIPYGLLFSDFNTASQINAFYLARSTTGGTPAATDFCQVVGRFNAKMDSSFAWSLPTTSIIIQRPVTNTRSLSFTCGFGNGTNAIGNGTAVGAYTFNNNLITLRVIIEFGSTTVFDTGNEFRFRLPFTWPAGTTTMGSAHMNDTTGPGSDYTGTVANAPGANYAIIRLNSASFTSGIDGDSPFTWAQDDDIVFNLSVIL